MKEVKKTNLKLKGDVKRYVQPTYTPFRLPQDELIRKLIEFAEIDDSIEEIDNQECTIKNHRTIFLGTLTHRYKISGRHYYGVEVTIKNVVYHRYVTSRELKLVNSNTINIVNEGVLELATID